MPTLAEASQPPYNVGDLPGGAKRRAPAAARNVEPIGDVLERWLPSSGLVLEVASGTGEHALAFARRFPALEWQPSDPDPLAVKSIEAWRAEGPANLRAPLRIDAQAADWGLERADAVLCINMVHISPWQSALALIAGAASLLDEGAPLILYGPWLIDGVETAPSNRAFDADLKARDPRWGLRRVEDFAAAAAPQFAMVETQAMPANNRMLLFRRNAPLR